MTVRFAEFDTKKFFTQVTSATATSRVLMLDYDGTLAPFSIKRDEAFPYRGVQDILERMIENRHTRVVIITGRTITDILPLLGLSSVPEIWGIHGWEHLHSNGLYELAYFPEILRKSLKEAQTILELNGLSDYLEIKPVSVAVHWRGQKPDDILKIRDSVLKYWEPFTVNTSLQIHSFDGGLELRVMGRSKGFPVQKIIKETTRPPVIAYLGDDLTDEDAYKTLGHRGLRVLVRDQLRSTKADVWIRPPEELLQFLHSWHIAAIAK